jgi:hypothetical protein
LSYRTCLIWGYRTLTWQGLAMGAEKILQLFWRREGRCSASPGMEKSVFQSVFTMKKEFSAAFRQEPYFWK